MRVVLRNFFLAMTSIKLFVFTTGIEFLDIEPSLLHFDAEQYFAIIRVSVLNILASSSLI